MTLTEGHPVERVDRTVRGVGTLALSRQWKGLADLPEQTGTEDNRAHYPQHGHQAEGAGFPLASGALLGAALDPCQGKGTGEHGLFRELHEVFVAGDLMLVDSDYCTYFLIAVMQSRGVDVVFEQHGARKTDFRRGQSVGTRDHWMTRSKPSRPTTAMNCSTVFAIYAPARRPSSTSSLRSSARWRAKRASGFCHGAGSLSESLAG